MFGRTGPKNSSGKVCDFFLQGRCKFGDGCKFEHPKSPAAPGNNRFAALSGQAGAKGSNSKNLPYLLSRDSLVSDLKEERPNWPFSAYGPGRDAPRQLFEGPQIEQSPEEMRVMYYLAQAAGNPQPAIEAEQQIYRQMNDQSEKALKDPEGALQYILAGDNEHPNRRDMCLVPDQNNTFFKSQPSTTFGQPSGLGNTVSGSAFGSSTFGQPSAPLGGQSAFGQPSQLSNRSAFGQPSQMGSTSAFGQPNPASSTSGSGQPSQMGASSAFGQPSQPGTGSAFGQPSQPGAASAFGQPSQLGAASAFGQPSQPGAASAFGQPSQPGSTSAFGQPSQPGATSAFGQPSQPGAFGAPSALGGASGFGQPSSLGQQSSTFGQPSQPNNPFSSQTSSSGFAIANQASPFASAQNHQANTASPFGQQPQASSSPFASASQNQSSPFATAQQPNPSPFASQTQNQANTSAVKSPLLGHAHPPAPSNGTDTATPPTTSYAQHQNGQLRVWKGNAVKYVDNAPYFSDTGRLNDASSLERIWLPDGPPPPNPYMSEAEEVVARFAQGLEGAYRSCNEQGAFEGGVVPLLAPHRAWTRFDI